MSAGVGTKREIKVSMPRIAPFVAARGRRTMVVTMPRGEPRPVHGVVFADEVNACPNAIGEVVHNRGRG